MKKLILGLLLSFSLLTFGQDLSPLPSITVKKLIAPNNPVFYYNTADSALWVFKGETGWLRIATNEQLEKYWVPYFGAIKDVVLGLNGLYANDLTSNFLQILTGATPTTSAPGLIQWNAVDGTYDMGLLNSSILQVGQETMFYGKAVGAIANGDLCQFAGVQGDHILIKKAVGSEIEANPHFLIGVATENIANGVFGYVTWFGKINGVYTNTPNNQDSQNWLAGDILYFNSATGQLTKTMPSPPNRVITVAAVIKVQTGTSESGVILVRPQAGNKLVELDDVNGTPLTTTGQFPIWNNTNKYFDFDYKLWGFDTGLIQSKPYDSTWNGQDSVTASKDAIYDKINSMEMIQYCPTTMTVNRGTLIQGTAADLCAVGGTDVIINELTGTDPLRVTFGFSSVARMTAFTFYGDYNGGASHISWVEIYNPSTLAWDFLGEFGNSTTKQWYSFNIFQPTTYISAGVVQIRINHQGSGINTHNLILDYVDVNYGGGGGGTNIEASTVSFTPTGTIASTNVQAAIAELDNEKEPVFSKGNLASGNPTITVTNGTNRLVGGTATVSITSGYGIPSTASQTTWDSAYNNNVNSISVTGTGTETKTITLTKQNGATLSATFTDLTGGSSSQTYSQAYLNEANITSSTITVTFPASFPHINYALNLRAWYIDTVESKAVQISHAIYDFNKTVSGFSFKVDTVSGRYSYFAADTAVVYSSQDDRTKIVNEIPSGLINGTNTTFTLAKVPNLNTQQLYINGVRLTPTLDYTINSNNITMNSPPLTGYSMLADYSIGELITNEYYNEVPSGIINGINTIFTLVHSVSGTDISLFLNGVRQRNGIDFTISGNEITFIIAPLTGYSILADYKN